MDSPATFRLPALGLDESRRWRVALVALFGLALLCRFLVYLNVAGAPLGRLAEWVGTDPWFYAARAERMVLDADWIARGGNMLPVPGMEELAAEAEWDSLGGRNLPRGAVALYLMAASFAVSGSMALYQMLSLLAGAALAVVAAEAGARLFRDRRAGLIAGLLAASNQNLVVLAVVPGPWMWEALALGLVVLCLLRVRDGAGNPAEWLLLGLATALAIWTRPFFWWGVLLAPVAALAWRVPLKPATLAAWALPIAVAATGLSARNVAVGASPMPVVGAPAWDFARTLHPGAHALVDLPDDLTVLRAAEGNFLTTLRLSLSQSAHREALPRILSRKLRETLGARDQSWSFSFDYMARRAETLRMTTLGPDMVAGLGWAAVLFLLYWRRLPGALTATLAILVLHALLFSPAGGDRAPLHLCASLAIAGALVLAWDQRARNPAMPLVFLTVWAACHLFLQIDDQARGSRYRAFEFGQSAQIYRREGRRADFDREVRDFKNIRRAELVLGGYWNAER